MLADTDISSKLSKKGWHLVDISEQEGFTYVKARCPEGHRYTFRKQFLHRVRPCSYCAGIKLSPEEVIAEAEAQGYMVKALCKSVDSHGNFFIKKLSKILLECPRGHLRCINACVLHKELSCAKCPRRKKQTNK